MPPALTFFENVFNLLGDLELTYDCRNIIVGGDFNLNFKKSETKNRNFPAQVSRIAKIVENLINIAGLADSWQSSSEFTWIFSQLSIEFFLQKISSAS